VTAQIIAAVAAVLVALVGGGVGWDQVKRHGAETERRKQAERERDAANVRADHANKPPASVSEAVGILRLLRRRRRVRKESGDR